MSYYTRVSPTGILEAHCIDETTTEGAVEMLRKLISVGVIVPDHYKYARVDYDCSKGLNFDAQNIEEHFALKFKGDQASEPILLISPITAGYGGSGPTACFRCLQIMGFISDNPDDHQEIFTKRTFKTIDGKWEENPIIHLVYIK